MFITLLTHTEELKKSTNTGQLVLEQARAFGVECERVIWQRKDPDAALLQRLTQPSALLYPSDNAEPWPDAAPAHIVLIDSTWQQARKIYNHSPYLHSHPHLKLDAAQSRFTLRRNQIPGGLCTCEAIATIAQGAGLSGFAQSLDSALAKFILTRQL